MICIEDVERFAQSKKCARRFQSASGQPLRTLGGSWLKHPLHPLQKARYSLLVCVASPALYLLCASGLRSALVHPCMLRSGRVE